MDNRRGRPSILPAAARRHIAILPIAGLVPSFLLAIYSMTEPWAKARVVGVFGISRNPEAALLIAVSLAAMVGAGVAMATRRRGPLLASVVHLITGLFMCSVAWAAFGMVRRASVKILFIPFASVHPGPGLRHFLIAALLVVALGGLEGVLAFRRMRVAQETPSLEGTMSQGR
jgi:hypothetical protein